MISKKTYKQFELKDKLDYIRYLNSLILQFHINFKKYQRYFSELNRIIVEHYDKEKKSISDIEAETYDSINDKLHDTSMTLIKLIGDQQKVSSSYKKFRALLDKSAFSNEVDPLSFDLKSLLDEFMNLRHWMFHNPESLLNSEEEVAMKKVSPELRDYVQRELVRNPLEIIIYEYYNGAWLASLHLHTDARIKKFSQVFQQMKKDYSKLIGESIRIEIKHEARPRELFDDSSKTIQLSMAMQKGIYDGTDEKFSKLLFQ